MSWQPYRGLCALMAIWSIWCGGLLADSALAAWRAAALQGLTGQASGVLDLWASAMVPLALLAILVQLRTAPVGGDG